VKEGEEGKGASTIDNQHVVVVKERMAQRQHKAVLIKPYGVNLHRFVLDP
jgi:hypothetical protein